MSVFNHVRLSDISILALFGPNTPLCVTSQRLYQDSLDARLSSLIQSEILSCATYLANILCGGKLLSAFEMVRGYTPSIACLPFSSVSSQLRDAQIFQQASRALQMVLHDKLGQVLSCHLLPND